MVRQLHARRYASRRLPGGDPWRRYERPGVRGYEEAALHLLDCGVTPAPNRDGLRAMWRRDEHSRQAAVFIAQAWELVA